MKKTIKSIISVLMVLTLCLCTSAVAFAANDGTTAEALRFGEDGKLKIMHITDTHLHYDNVEASTWLIANACDREQPDVVMLTGDIAMDPDPEAYINNLDKLMTIFEEREIPVAFTQGNHDYEEGGFSRDEVMALYNRYDCSISVDDGEILPRCGTYNIPVLASDSDEMKFNLWVFDTGSLDSEGRYENATAEQVEWYTQKSEALEKANGEKINSLVFQHIVVPEIYDCLEKTNLPGAYQFEHIYNKGEYYRFSPEFENQGTLNEYPCPGYENAGQFEAMVSRGDVLAMFTGHDHTNTFDINYKGIRITNSLSTRFNGDAFSTQYGYRMITVDENDTSTYETKVVHWYDYFDSETVAQLSETDSYGYKLAQKINFLGFFEKMFEKIAIILTELFTGRTVSYE